MNSSRLVSYNNNPIEYVRLALYMKLKLNIIIKIDKGIKRKQHDFYDAYGKS